MIQGSGAGERRKRLIRSVLDGLHKAGWDADVSGTTVRVEGISVPLAYFERDLQGTIDKLNLLVGIGRPGEPPFIPYYPPMYERPASYRVELDITEKSG